MMLLVAVMVGMRVFEGIVPAIGSQVNIFKIIIDSSEFKVCVIRVLFEMHPVDVLKVFGSRGLMVVIIVVMVMMMTLVVHVPRRILPNLKGQVEGFSNGESDLLSHFPLVTGKAVALIRLILVGGDEGEGTGIMGIRRAVSNVVDGDSRGELARIPIQ